MKRIYVLLTLMIALSCFAGDFSGLEEVQAIISGNTGTVSKDMARISELFLSRPYDPTGPLGEGEDARFDSDPLWRLDRFDCTTFVETVTALALSRTVLDFKRNITAIRYNQGNVSYIDRNHFTSLDWIPNNITAGFFRDISSDIAGPEIETAKAVINRRAWYMSKKADSLKLTGLDAVESGLRLLELRLSGRNFEPVTASLTYVPLSSLFRDMKPSGEKKTAHIPVRALFRRIPSGSVINIVRPGWNLVKVCGTELNVSHQGLAIRKNGELYFRHAAFGRCVQDELMTEYLARYLNHATIRGINVLAVMCLISGD
ncbi:MAG: DUF1460 domain-containing protein [Candidatus Wallbacteria bacterium]|nr:DUF1460 domain-containing protein [Candidatus Wallbacteria bacterium]